MAFEKRTWLARIGTGLNKFIIGEKDANNRQTLTNAPDLPLTQEGDVISADNLNDLEDRIDNGFDGAHTELVNGLATKQDTLTFDNAPTNGSTNPVTSGGVFTALYGKLGTSDIVVESRNLSSIPSSITDGTGYIQSINIAKTGYTAFGIVGYGVMLSKDGTLSPAKIDIDSLYITEDRQSVYLHFVALETTNLYTTYSGGKVDILYIKNS